MHFQKKIPSKMLGNEMGILGIFWIGRISLMGESYSFLVIGLWLFLWLFWCVCLRGFLVQTELHLIWFEPKKNKTIT